MKLTKKQAKEIQALKRMPDEDIDLADIPEVVSMPRAFVGRFYRPIKKSLTVRIDVDVLTWIKSEGPGYQTRINAYLRRAMRRSVGAPSEDLISLEGGTLPSLTQTGGRSSLGPTTW